MNLQDVCKLAKNHVQEALEPFEMELIDAGLLMYEGKPTEPTTFALIAEGFSGRVSIHLCAKEFRGFTPRMLAYVAAGYAAGALDERNGLIFDLTQIGGATTE